MARQTGIIKIEGKIGGLSFYKTKNGDFVREASGVSGERIKRDRRYDRTRRNLEEFGGASTAGKHLRYAFAPLMREAKDGLVSSRLQKQMGDVAKLDTTSLHGKRNVATGIESQKGKEHLIGFKFNKEGKHSSGLCDRSIVNVKAGAFTIKKFIPLYRLSFPKGATHFRLTGGIAKVDFLKDKWSAVFTNTVTLPIDKTARNISLIPARVPEGNGTSFYVLQVVFLLIVNGEEYAIRNHKLNSLEIIEVA